MSETDNTPQNLTPQSLTTQNALDGLGEFLHDKVAPAVIDPFVAPMTRLSGLLLRICTNAVDDAAEIRVEENAAIRAILGEAAALVAAPLADELTASAATADPGLKISVLDAENHRLRSMLVSAHTALEANNDMAARALDQKIWRFLETTEAIRAPRD